MRRAESYGDFATSSHISQNLNTDVSFYKERFCRAPKLERKKRQMLSTEDDYHLRQLERLILHDSTLTGIMLRPLRDIIYDREEFLDIIAEICQAAKENPQVVSIDVYNIPLNHPLIMYAITNLLTCDDRIWKRIHIAKCEAFDPRFLADAICCRSSHPCRIRSLKFLNTRLLSDGLLHLCRIMTWTKDLEDLAITDNLDADGLTILSSGLCANNTISHLDLGGCRFDCDDDVFESSFPLVMGLKGASRLNYLSLNLCRLPDQQIATLVIALENHSFLHELVLSHNECGPKACHALVGLIRNKLTCLTLNSCGITDADLSILLRGLSESQNSLERLYLSRNLISNFGIIELASLLRTNTSLRSVTVGDNKFGALGANELLQALESNYDLRNVALDKYFACFCKIQFLCEMNRCGRKVLQSHQENVPLGLWPLVLERAPRRKTGPRKLKSADVLFYFLREFVTIQWW